MRKVRLSPGRADISYEPLRRAARRIHWPGRGDPGRAVAPARLHGVFISRYAVIGANCRIYQNVTIGEIAGKAPEIGDGCLIGAGAVLVGGIRVGPGAKIGAGAVVHTDVPAGATVVSPGARIIERREP